MAIGTNVSDSIRPYGSFGWAYSLFQSFGTGAFNPDYSGVGAYVIAASGGHNSTPNVDAAVFDFADATWKRVANTNGVAQRERDYPASETTGSPYFEILAAARGQLPAPPHLYQICSYIPSQLGGGTRGSYLKIGSPAVCVEARKGGGIHRMELSSGLWTRATNDTVDFGLDNEACTVFDPATGRYYFIVDGFHRRNSLQYLDSADWTVKTTASYPYPASWDGDYNTVFLEPTLRLLVSQRPGYPLRALDLNNVAGGWATLNTTGPQPRANRWARYAPDGRFYTRTNDSGQTLFRLTPPSANWRTGTWAIDTVSISGASMPSFTTTGGNCRHYGTFFYVPAIQCLAWISGESSPVVLVKPPV